MLFEGSNTGARLDSVETGVVRVGDDDVGDEFAVGDDVIVVKEEREAKVADVGVEVEDETFALSEPRRCCGCKSKIGVL